MRFWWKKQDLTLRQRHDELVIQCEAGSLELQAEKMAENHLIFVDAERSQENYAIPSAFAAYAKYMGIRLGNEKFLETD